MNKKAAKDGIAENCGNGWLTLVDIIFDNKPDHIEITEVFQKYSGLHVRYQGEDSYFDELLSAIDTISRKMCEVCGNSGGHTIVDGWETTLCDHHYNSSDAKEKYREEK
jgi:hypothetical protein